MGGYTVLLLVVIGIATISGYVLRLNAPEIIVHDRSAMKKNGNSGSKDGIEIPPDLVEPASVRHRVEGKAHQMKKVQQKLKNDGWSYAAHIVKNKKTPARGFIDKARSRKPIASHLAWKRGQRVAADRIAQIVKSPKTYWFTLDENQKETGKLPFMEKAALVDDDSVSSHTVDDLNKENKLLARSDISNQGLSQGPVKSSPALAADKGSIVDEESAAQGPQLVNTSSKARGPGDNEVEIGKSKASVPTEDFDKDDVISTDEATGDSSGSDDAPPLKEDSIDEGETVDTSTGDAVTLNTTAGKELAVKEPSSAEAEIAFKGVSNDKAEGTGIKDGEAGSIIQNALTDDAQDSHNSEGDMSEEMEEDVEKEEEGSGVRMEQGIDDSDYVDTATGESVDLNSDENEVTTDQKGGEALEGGNSTKNSETAPKKDQDSKESFKGSEASGSPLPTTKDTENSTTTKTAVATKTGRPKSLMEGVDIGEFTNSNSRNRISHKAVPEDEFASKGDARKTRDEFSEEMGGLVVNEETSPQALVDSQPENTVKDTENPGQTDAGIAEETKAVSQEGTPDEFNEQPQVKSNTRDLDKDSTAVLSAESSDKNVEKEEFDKKAEGNESVSVLKDIEKEKDDLLQKAQNLFNIDDKEEDKMADLEFNKNSPNAKVGESDNAEGNGSLSAAEADKSSNSEAETNSAEQNEKNEFNENTVNESGTEVSQNAGSPNIAEYNETSDISENINSSSLSAARGLQGQEDSESQTWQNGPEFHPKSELGPEFNQKSELGPEFHQKADLGPEFHQKAELGPEFHQKAELGPEFHQKAELGPEFHQKAEFTGESDEGPQKSAQVLPGEKVSDNISPSEEPNADSESHEFAASQKSTETVAPENPTARPKDEFGEAKQVMQDLSKKITSEVEGAKDTVFKPVDEPELSVLQSKLDTAKRLYEYDSV